MRDITKVAAYSLGCKVNSYDTEAMLALFCRHSYKVVKFSEKADVYIINTCTVTALGSRKSRQLIYRARKQNPNALVVATGCYAQVAPEEVQKIDGVNLVLGTTNRGDIVSAIEQYQCGTVVKVSNVMEETTFEDLPATSLDRTRATLKIQDGCGRFCSFCIIPYARGPSRSRTVTSCLQEAEGFAAKGFQEIVLVGIHLASYGKDLEYTTLSGLLEHISKIDGIRRIRLGSLAPEIIQEDFVQTLKSLHKVCDHFHISLQSGCDTTLQRMNRHYTAEQYAKAINRIRAHFPLAAVTTDVIVGFPAESQKHFEESLSFVEAMGFSRLHVFPYSPKEGTEAAGFSEQIPQEIKMERCKQMMSLGERLQQNFLKGMLGNALDVLFEKDVGDGFYEGYSTNYALVRAKSHKSLMNTVVNITVNRLYEGILY